jgi:hypothetical protein
MMHSKIVVGTFHLQTSNSKYCFLCTSFNGKLKIYLGILISLGCTKKHTTYNRVGHKPFFWLAVYSSQNAILKN